MIGWVGRKLIKRLVPAGQPRGQRRCREHWTSLMPLFCCAVSLAASVFYDDRFRAFRGIRECLLRPAAPHGYASKQRCLEETWDGGAEKPEATQVEDDDQRPSEISALTWLALSIFALSHDGRLVGSVFVVGLALRSLVAMRSPHRSAKSDVLPSPIVSIFLDVARVVVAMGTVRVIWQVGSFEGLAWFGIFRVIVVQVNTLLLAGRANWYHCGYDDGVHGHLRALVLLMVNTAEVVGWFGLIYQLHPSWLGTQPVRTSQALLVSWRNLVSFGSAVGLEEPNPRSLFAVITEGFSGLLLVAAALGIMVNRLADRKTKDAYEDWLRKEGSGRDC